MFKRLTLFIYFIRPITVAEAYIILKNKILFKKYYWAHINFI